MTFRPQDRISTFPLFLINVIPKTWQDFLKEEAAYREFSILVSIMIVFSLSLKCQTITLLELKSYKVIEVIKMLKDDSWYLVAQKGNH